MTPFFHPTDISADERPALLRRRAEAHRLALESEPRTPRRGFGHTFRRAGDGR